MSLTNEYVFIQCGLLMNTALPPSCAPQKEILMSDVVVCSVAYILTFAITASTVFLSLKVRFSLISSFHMLPFRNTDSSVFVKLFIFILFLSLYNDLFPALCDHRAVRSGGDGGVCNPLPYPPAEEASPLVVDLPSGPQDQGVPPV